MLLLLRLALCRATAVQSSRLLFFKNEFCWVFVERRPGDTLAGRKDEKPAFIPRVWSRGISVFLVFLIGLREFFSKLWGWFSCHFRSALQDDSLPAILQMDRHVWVGTEVDGMPRLRAAIVIDHPIHVNAPARHHVWASIGADRTKPIMFGFRQLRGDPIPS